MIKCNDKTHQTRIRVQILKITLSKKTFINIKHKL